MRPAYLQASLLIHMLEKRFFWCEKIIKECSYISPEILPKCINENHTFGSILTENVSIGIL